MSPLSRRDAVAALRTSIPSLAGIAARVASPARSRARARRWMARTLLLSPVIAIVLSDALRRGKWLARMGGEDVRSYAASLAMTCVFWAALLCVAARRRPGPGRIVARALLVIGAILAVGGQLYTLVSYHAT